MARIQPGGLKRPLVLASFILTMMGISSAHAADRAPLRDAPVVWYADDDKPIPVPEFFEPGLIPYSMESFVSRPFSRFFHPGRFGRKVSNGDAGRRAPNVNSIDEVINSSWSTNRIGL